MGLRSWLFGTKRTAAGVSAAPPPPPPEGSLRTSLVNGNYADVYGGAGSDPALVLFHGGGWVSGSPSIIAALARRIAGEDIGVCAPSYRVLDRGRASVADAIEDGTNAMIHLTTRKALAVGGASSGGLLSLHVALRCPNLVTKLVLLNPVTDTSQGGFANRQIPHHGNDFVSPMSFVHRLRHVPTLILHSTEDQVVLVEQSRRFLATWSNPNATLIEWPSGPHGFFNLPEHRDPVAEAIRTFLR